MHLYSFVFITLFSAAVCAAESSIGPNNIFREESWDLPAGVRGAQIESVVYGNIIYGYFKSPAKIQNQRIVLGFFPPGYERPIEFAIQLKNSSRRIKLGQKRYRSPFRTVGIAPEIQLKGQFSQPFFLLTWTSEKSTPATIVLNRVGEPVWALPSPQAHRVMGTHRASARISKDKLLVQNDGGHIGYSEVDIRSGRSTPLVSRQAHVFHHVFDYIPESHELVALAVDCRQLKWWQEYSPVFEGLAKFWRLWDLPRRSITGSQIIRVNLATGKERVIWSTFDSFKPQQNLSRSMLNDVDSYQDIKEPWQYLALKRRPQYSEDVFGFRCDTDWSHENSVRFYPGQGYLVSIRNLNKVVLIGEDGKLNWSLGGAGDNDYMIEDLQTAFSQAHDAQLNGDNVLLFDNHNPFRGGTENRFFHPSYISEYSLKKGEAKRLWTFTVPMPRASFRGSVTPIANGNVVAFVSDDKTPAIRFFELQRKDETAVAFMRIFYPTELGPPLIARPMSSIYTEQFVPEPEALRLAPVPFDAVLKEVRVGY